MQTRLDQARIPYTAVDVAAVTDSGTGTVVVGYRSSVTAQFEPIFGGMSVPTLTTPIVIIPSTFNIDYNNIYYSTMY
jgi:hypothetical protein